MVDEFSKLKKDFNKKFVKPRYVDDLDLGLFWGWIIENFVPVEAIVRQGDSQPVQAAGSWVSVKDNLPDNGKHVLCLTDSGLRSIGYLYDKKWERAETIQSFYECGYKVTHWMPLPDKIKR
jgi:hypothetical protein